MPGGVIPSSFLCPVTQQLMADPVSTSDGFSYEREAISEWLAGGNLSSPMTGAALGRAELVPNHALRSAIQQFLDEHPEVSSELYVPGTAVGAKKVATAQSAATAQPSSDAEVPIGLPIEPPVVVPVQAPPPAPLTGLTEQDYAMATQLAVGNWEHLCAPPTTARSSRGWNPFGSGRSSAESTTHTDEPVMRASAADGGGVALDVSISSQATLQRLALRLAARLSAPIVALKISADESVGPNTASPLSLEGSAAFQLLARTLKSAESTRQLRELSLARISVDASAAALLANALSGHASLTSLELWNVSLEDEGALSIGQLVAEGGTNPTLRELNMGRNLISAEAREQIEALIGDSAAVRVKMF